MASKKLLSQFLTTPSKVASALDWKKASGSILSLKIDRDNLSLNLAQHPSIKQDCKLFQPIPIKYEVRNNRKVVVSSVTEALLDIIQANKVCGIVVDWPVQREGRIGASCGRVLHLLDNLLESQVVSQNRKVCLWDGEHVPMEKEDQWGRCTAYGRKCDKTEHVASRDQYTDTTSSHVAHVWNDFSQAHWPELYERKGASTPVSSPKARAHHNGAWREIYDKEGTYLQASSL
jgi:hypothetical protein